MRSGGFMVFIGDADSPKGIGKFPMCPKETVESILDSRGHVDERKLGRRSGVEQSKDVVRQNMQIVRRSKGRCNAFCDRSPKILSDRVTEEMGDAERSTETAAKTEYGRMLESEENRPVSAHRQSRDRPPRSVDGIPSFHRIEQIMQQVFFVPKTRLIV